MNIDLDIKFDIISQKENIDVDLLKAIANVESGLNPSVVRYEKNYKWLSDCKKWSKLNNITFDTELILESMSWGIMQIMGATCRDFGYTAMLTELIKSDLSILYGAKYLKSLLIRYENNEQNAISAYNAGSVRRINGKYSNQEYVDKVNFWLKQLRSR